MMTSSLPPYRQSFTNATRVAIPYAAHQRAGLLIVLVYSDQAPPLPILDAQVEVDPSTRDIAVTFIRLWFDPRTGIITEEPLPPQSGTVVVVGALTGEGMVR